MVKNLPASGGNMGSIPGLEKSPGEGNGYPLQYSCLGNTMDRGAWWAIVHGIANWAINTLTFNDHTKVEKKEVKFIANV